MAKRLAVGRREELLDGVMQIIAARGFATVQVSEMARAELHCSVATLYKIAPSKDSLVLSPWRGGPSSPSPNSRRRRQGRRTRPSRPAPTSERGPRVSTRFALAFFADVMRFESTRLAWTTNVVDRDLVRSWNSCNVPWTLGRSCRSIPDSSPRCSTKWDSLTGDERVLSECGLTSEEAVLAVDQIIWQTDSRARPAPSSRSDASIDVTGCVRDRTMTVRGAQYETGSHLGGAFLAC